MFLLILFWLLWVALIISCMIDRLIFLLLMQLNFMYMNCFVIILFE